MLSASNKPRLLHLSDITGSIFSTAGTKEFDKYELNEGFLSI